MFGSLFELLAKSIFMILHVSNIGEFPRTLSKEEEEEYLRQFHEEGSEEARAKLIEHNLRLVAHIIKKYNTTAEQQEDLISIGTIGLIKAVSSFKPSKGIRLATYAARCIENEILMHFRNQKKSAQDVYMSDPIDVDKEGNALTLSDIISEDDDIVDSIDISIKSKKLKEFIKTELTERERAIIEYRYGLFGKPELTQREVAKRLNISRSYVSRIEKHALKILNERFKGE